MKKILIICDETRKYSYYHLKKNRFSGGAIYEQATQFNKPVSFWLALTLISALFVDFFTTLGLSDLQLVIFTGYANSTCDRQAHANNIQEQIARDELDVIINSDYLEGMRWLKRVSWHLMRTSFHYKRAILAAGK